MSEREMRCSGMGWVLCGAFAKVMSVRQVSVRTIVTGVDARHK